MRRLLVLAAVAAAVFVASGCRTGIRRVANAIEGQGASSIEFEKSAEKTALNYLTSENSAFSAEGLVVEIDPATGKYLIQVDRANLARSPSENQQYFAQQLAQGRTADTEALAAYGQITGAVVEGAVKAAIQAFVPAYTTRQEQKTARRQISADRDVALAEMHGEAAEGHAAPAPEGGAPE